MRQEEDIEDCRRDAAGTYHREPSSSCRARAQHPSRVSLSRNYGAGRRSLGGRDSTRNRGSALVSGQATGRNTWSLFNADCAHAIAPCAKAERSCDEEAVVGGGLEIAFHLRSRLDTGELPASKRWPPPMRRNRSFISRDYLATRRGYRPEIPGRSATDTSRGPAFRASRDSSRMGMIPVVSHSHMSATDTAQGWKALVRASRQLLKTVRPLSPQPPRVEMREHSSVDRRRKKSCSRGALRHARPWEPTTRR